MDLEGVGENAVHLSKQIHNEKGCGPENLKFSAENASYLSSTFLSYPPMPASDARVCGSLWLKLYIFRRMLGYMEPMRKVWAMWAGKALLGVLL
jgi:hypothetical protein